MSRDLYELIRRCAIQTRIRYGKADEKLVLGRILSEIPEIRGKRNILRSLRWIVAEVNIMSVNELDMYWKRIRERVNKLKLPGEPINVVMRFAPNPNGPATIGSARGIIVNSEIARNYNGRFILRFDDTDPKTKKPLKEAYNWYIEDCKWLGAEPDEIYIASERIPNYYRYAEELIKMGKAYVCFCSREKFKKLRDSKKPCPHRNQSPKENLKFWNKMLSREYEDGECVLKIKTDINNKDPALRDWTAFRIISEEHPRVGRRYVVWPMLDFESAIEDHILGVTHIIRGKDLMDSEMRQKFIYQYLNWKYPVTLHWGRIKVHEFGKFSTSEIRKAIERGEYSGWDDPSLPTIKALRRRGISPDAIRNLIISLGITENDISISMENLFAENRKVIDSKANRYFFVPNPVKIIVKNAPEKVLRLPLHPSFSDRGYREFRLKLDSSGDMTLFIPEEDTKKIKEGEIIRLKDLFNVRISKITDKVIAEYLKEKILTVKKIHWVQSHLDAEVIMPKQKVSGFCEPGCSDLAIGDIIQFERFGFVRLDKKDGKIVFYFAHR